MVTIERLSVEFDVAGDDQEAAFAVLFNKHITAWQRADREARQRERQTARARTIVGPPPEEA